MHAIAYGCICCGFGMVGVFLIKAWARVCTFLETNVPDPSLGKFDNDFNSKLGRSRPCKRPEEVALATMGAMVGDVCARGLSTIL